MTNLICKNNLKKKSHILKKIKKDNANHLIIKILFYYSHDF